MAEIEKKLFYGIKELEDENFFQNEFVIFGAGYCAEILYDALKYRGYIPSDIIDNSEMKKGARFHDYIIKYAPEYLKEAHDVKFLVFSTYYVSIREQMISEGLIENKDFYPVAILHDNKYEKPDIQFDIKISDLYRGKKVYDNLRLKYGENCHFFVNPASSIGDVYLMNFYIDRYRNKDEILFLFGTKILYRLAKFSNINNSTLITMDEIHDLLTFAEVFGFDEIKVSILHTGVTHYRIWSRMLTLRKITWMEHYRELFDLANYSPSIAMPKEYDHDVTSYFENNGLIAGKTAIISPYANTLKQMSFFEWDRIVELMQEKGFIVCTNIGSNIEVALHNTIPLHIDIEDFPAVVERAGCFIGTRSGLCDFLIGNKAKKIIFYTNEIFDFIKVKDFYSIAKVGDTNSLEIESDHITDETLNRISLYLGN